MRETINRGHNQVVDCDIEKYFDTIDHQKLMDLLRQRVSDREVLGLIQRWLRAGVMKEGRIEPTEEGVPQGGPLSPLLSNIYLHELDKQWHRQYGELGKLIRYADDFVILCRKHQAAERTLLAVQEILGGLKLRLHPQKTRLVDLYRGKQGFDFLGFHFHKRASWKYPKPTTV